MITQQINKNVKKRKFVKIDKRGRKKWKSKKLKMKD